MVKCLLVMADGPTSKGPMGVKSVFRIHILPPLPNSAQEGKLKEKKRKRRPLKLIAPYP